MEKNCFVFTKENRNSLEMYLTKKSTEVSRFTGGSAYMLKEEGIVTIEDLTQRVTVINGPEGTYQTLKKLNQ